MSIKYIVTGTGRCGTMFMSKFLTSAGVNCGHEIIFTNDGIVAARENLLLNEDLEADSSYMAAPYLNTDLLSNAKIIHVVREPMRVINSFVVAFCYFLSSVPTCESLGDEWTYEYPPGADPEFKFMKFMYSQLPALHAKFITPAERAAVYYIEWNKMIERACKGRDFLFHPIESDINNVARFVNADNSNLYGDKNTNKVEYNHRFSISDISEPIKSSLISIGRKYGYFKSVKVL